MSYKSTPTPDMLPRFNRANHLDKTEHGTVGHEMAPIIKGARDIAKSPLGKPSHLDQNVGKNMFTKAEDLGVGGGRLNDAVRSIKSGAQAPKADSAFLRKG